MPGRNDFEAGNLCRSRSFKMAESDRLLPLVPLSPLTKNKLVTAQALKKANEALNSAKASSKSTSTETLRHLYENERIEKTRLEALEEQIQSVQSVTSFKWDADTIARQIAIINCQLYRQIKLDNNLAFSDPGESLLLYFTDFQRYLTSSFTHQLIYWSEISRASDGKDIDPPIQHRDSLISHLVKVAYLLLHAYRDFSGCIAIMKALSSSEVRRIRRLWTQCPSRSKDLYKELVLLLSPANEYRSYRNTLVQKLNSFSSDPRSKDGMMIAIPWSLPHLNQIHHIAREYTAGGQDLVLDDKRQRLLSAPGAKKLEEVMAVLRECQSNSSSEWEDLGTTSMVKTIALSGIRKGIDPPIDILKMAPGNLGVHHWLVSRVYLTKQQLIDESMEVEPLAPGEELLCDNIEMNDEANDVRSGLDVPSESDDLVSSTGTAREQINDPSLQRSPSLSVEEEIRFNGIKDTSNDQPAPDVVSSVAEPVFHDAITEETNEPNQEQAVAPPEETEVESTRSEAASPSQFSDPLGLESPALPSENIAGLQSVVKEFDNEGNKEDHEETTISKEPTSGNLAASPKPEESRFDSRKSRLSPRAPEFVPKLMSMAPVAEYFTSNDTASPSSSTTFEEDLTAVPKDDTPRPAIPTGPEQSSEEEEEEVWRGYQPSSPDVHGNNQGHDSDSDKWNGYPTPQSDDDEEWKGYPEPIQQKDRDSRRQSSRSSTSEDWKGYQAHKTEDTWKVESRQQASEHDWQGYTLETLDEDELDSSTMMNGEFGKKRRERESNTNYDPLESFKNQIQMPESSLDKPKFHEGGTIGRAASRRLQNKNSRPSTKNVL